MREEKEGADGPCPSASTRPGCHATGGPPASSVATEPANVYRSAYVMQGWAALTFSRTATCSARPVLGTASASGPQRSHAPSHPPTAPRAVKVPHVWKARRRAAGRSRSSSVSLNARAMAAYSESEHCESVGGDQSGGWGMEKRRPPATHPPSPTPLLKSQLTLEGLDILGASHPRWRAWKGSGLAAAPFRGPARGV